MLQKVVEQGEVRKERTGTGTRGLFGERLEVDLGCGFPLLTTKKMAWRAIAEELFWFLRGETNVRSLQAQGVKIWDKWADAEGELGPVYGHQWRRWDGDTDQIKKLLQDIRKSPDSRRLIVTAWNPKDLWRMALPPCHLLFQFHVSRGRLSCQLYQRSADMFLGVPFNIASYALLTHAVAHVTGLEVGRFVHVFGDCHVYENHLEQVEEQLSRTPKTLPKLTIRNARGGTVERLEDIGWEHLLLEGYRHHPAIRGAVAV